MIGGTQGKTLHEDLTSTAICIESTVIILTWIGWRPGNAD